jgi:hypothetical protein
MASHTIHIHIGKDDESGIVVSPSRLTVWQGDTVDWEVTSEYPNSHPTPHVVKTLRCRLINCSAEIHKPRAERPFGGDNPVIVPPGSIRSESSIIKAKSTSGCVDTYKYTVDVDQVGGARVKVLDPEIEIQRPPTLVAPVRSKSSGAMIAVGVAMIAGGVAVLATALRQRE